MNTIAFYQRHLDQVSRSFAFCIARLEDDLRLWVSISYLLCRMLDTIEDSSWKNETAKLQSFKLFQNFILVSPSEHEVHIWQHQFNAEIPAGERTLLAESFLIFSDFHELPIHIRSKICRGVLNMSRGMLYFSKKGSSRLKTLAEVNQYCFFVAGVVGELLTDLQSEKTIFLKVENLTLLSHHFGLFLQKINLLKDQFKDEAEGRFLVPSRSQLFQSLAINARYSLEYIQSIPIQSSGYRLFCSWSLFLGIYSLDWIQKSWALKVLDKIPRILTEQLMLKIQSIIDDNKALESLFIEKLKFAEPVSETSLQVELPWFDSLYEGGLDQQHLISLGMIG